MSPTQIRRWKLTIQRLEALAHSTPIQDFPEIAVDIEHAADQLRDRLGDLLVKEALR